MASGLSTESRRGHVGQICWSFSGESAETREVNKNEYVNVCIKLHEQTDDRDWIKQWH